MTHHAANRPARLLAAYDAQLRTDAETPDAINVTRLGPLRLVTFAGGRGFISYQNLGAVTTDSAQQLVSDALSHYQSDPDKERAEWETCGYD